MSEMLIAPLSAVSSNVVASDSVSTVAANEFFIVIVTVPAAVALLVRYARTMRAFVLDAEKAGTVNVSRSVVVAL